MGELQRFGAPSPEEMDRAKLNNWFTTIAGERRKNWFEIQVTGDIPELDKLFYKMHITKDNQDYFAYYVPITKIQDQPELSEEGVILHLEGTPLEKSQVPKPDENVPVLKIDALLRPGEVEKVSSLNPMDAVGLISESFESTQNL